MTFAELDILVFETYVMLVLVVATFVSSRKKVKSPQDYFLAGRALPWWVIGASLIAVTISAEQLIGMSSSGFILGLSVVSYEWIGAITLFIAGKFFLPIFMERRLYTIPEFIGRRFSFQLKSILALFWIGLYVFVNITAVLFIGAWVVHDILSVSLIWGVLGLAGFTASYSLYGGLPAVAWTDVIQVSILLLGSLFITHFELSLVSGGEGMIAGLSKLITLAPEKFHMALGRTDPNYINFPGIWVLMGGFWVANLYGFGFNQYVIQRAFAGRTIVESQKGIALAAFIKLVVPFVVVLPGIACYVMVNDPEILTTLDAGGLRAVSSMVAEPERAYSWLLHSLPSGIRGLGLAALVASVVSTLASLLNSTSTIFTMDIFKGYFKPEASNALLLKVGRLSALVALLIGCLIAPFLTGVNQVFKFIQEYVGLVSPGILMVILSGLFWKKTTNAAAIWGTLSSIPIALGFKSFQSVPLMNQMGLTAILTLSIIVTISLIDGKGADNPRALSFQKDLFKTSSVFNFSALTLSILLAVLYALFW